MGTGHARDHALLSRAPLSRVVGVHQCLAQIGMTGNVDSPNLYPRAAVDRKQATEKVEKTALSSENSQEGANTAVGRSTVDARERGFGALPSNPNVRPHPGIDQPVKSAFGFAKVWD
jgi:hypothetical protein